MLEILVGIVIGYVFKPQIELMLGKALKHIRDKAAEERQKEQYKDE